MYFFFSSSNHFNLNETSKSSILSRCNEMETKFLISGKNVYKLISIKSILYFDSRTYTIKNELH